MSIIPGTIDRKIMVQAEFRQKVRPYLKNNQKKRAEDVTKVVESLPHKYEALSSNSNTTKQTKNICSPKKTLPFLNCLTFK
jgi:hypothetical protein